MSHLMSQLSGSVELIELSEDDLKGFKVAVDSRSLPALILPNS